MSDFTTLNSALVLLLQSKNALTPRALSSQRPAVF